MPTDDQDDDDQPQPAGGDHPAVRHARGRYRLTAGDPGWHLKSNSSGFAIEHRADDEPDGRKDGDE